MCACLVPIFSLIVKRSVATFDRITPHLEASPWECAQWRRGLTHRSLRWFVVVSTIALVMGLANIIMAHPRQARGLLEDILSGHGKYMTYPGTLLPVLILFLRPVWPLHKRLRDAKRAELSMISDRLERVRSQPLISLDHPQTLDELNQVLQYRREIHQASTWPFDMPALTRFCLYLILPPLTWVAAALIEKLLDKIL